ncbi:MULTISPECIES: ABC transporter ATP-binding protein [Arthrobacter]|uniref:ABC transporter ATP-binding protein n=2 Tax=Arthrobacter TaxID=1663 RepID=A0ABU9KNC3_9MICC|nr:ABC transporter ATP-binding protein [Arthrobacter sp. YJM1]MDP5228359.1 ABC transporter ATP-binding protein [Arthrobacter sp. YJM1]
MSEDVVRVTDLTRRYKDVTALDTISLTFRKDRIYGLLGRNGAGKTTLMSVLTAQGFPSDGTVEVFGEDPYENEAVLRRLCFIRESQKYPDNFTPAQAFRAASLFFEGWDQEFALRLAEDFQLPQKRQIKKLSRGQLSAVGIIIGLASRAELTFFDEPYLGLDAVARHLFYDHLVRDYAEHPRTVVLSSHLIDEVANLLEHVVVIDRGRIIMNDDAEAVRGSAVTVSGPAGVVASFVSGREVLFEERLMNTASVSVRAQLSVAERREAAELGLTLGQVSLQQLVVHASLAHSGGGMAASQAAMSAFEAEFTEVSR